MECTKCSVWYGVFTLFDCAGVVKGSVEDQALPKVGEELVQSDIMLVVGSDMVD